MFKKPKCSKPKDISFFIKDNKELKKNIFLLPEIQQAYRIWCNLGGARKNNSTKPPFSFQFYKHNDKNYWFCDFLWINQILSQELTDKQSSVFFFEDVDNYILKSAWQEVIDLIGNKNINQYYLFKQLKQHAPKFIMFELIKNNSPTAKDFCGIAKISTSKFEKQKSEFDNLQSNKIIFTDREII